MKRIFLLGGLVACLWSCGDDRPKNAGAGNTEGVPSNTSVGTGNGGNTYDGGTTTNPQGGNARGQAEGDSTNKRTTGADSARTGSGNR